MASRQLGSGWLHDSVGIQSALVWTLDRSVIRLGVDADLTEGVLSEIQTRPTLGPFVQGVHYDYEVSARTLASFLMAERQVTIDAVTLSSASRVRNFCARAALPGAMVAQMSLASRWVWMNCHGMRTQGGRSTLL